jgi:hypothetical protein
VPGSSEGDVSSGDPGTSTGDGPGAVELVAWYPFEDFSRPGVIVDAMGVHDGACLVDECPGPAVGAVGEAARFDGVDDLVRVAHDDGLDLGATWTAAAWMLPTMGVGVGYQNLLGKPLSTEGFYDTIELAVAEGTSAAVGVASIDDGVSVWGPFSPKPGTWTHIAGTFDGTTLRLYVDGMMVGEAQAPAPYYSALAWTIGGGIDNDVPGNHFAGGIDELRLYRGVLTAEEIAALATVP